MNFSYQKCLEGQRWRKDWRRTVQWHDQVEIYLMEGHQGLTLLLMLQYAYRQDPGTSLPWESLRAADWDRSRNLHPTIKLKLCTTMVELGVAKGESNTIGRPAVTTNRDPMELPETEPSTRSIHRPAHCSWHKYSRHFPGLASVREDVPNPWELCGPREEWGLMVWGSTIMNSSGRGNGIRNCGREDQKWGNDKNVNK